MSNYLLCDSEKGPFSCRADQLRWTPGFIPVFYLCGVQWISFSEGVCVGNHRKCSCLDDICKALQVVHERSICMLHPEILSASRQPLRLVGQDKLLALHGEMLATSFAPRDAKSQSFFLGQCDNTVDIRYIHVHTVPYSTQRLQKSIL